MSEQIQVKNVLKDDIIDQLIRARAMYKHETGVYPTVIRLNPKMLHNIQATAWYLQNAPVFKDPTRFGQYILGMEIVVQDDAPDEIYLQVRD